jgi:hypothetical protein
MLAPVILGFQIRTLPRKRAATLNGLLTPLLSNRIYFFSSGFDAGALVLSNFSDTELMQ